MDVTATKVLIIFGLLATTFLAAVLPWLFVRYSLRRRKRLSRDNNSDKSENIANGSVKTTASMRRKKSRAKRAISGLNCFAGGIFLGTSFIGLLPEIREDFEKLEITWPSSASNSVPSINSTNSSEEEAALMPIAEIVVVCGLFLILTIEQAAHGWNHNRQKRKLAHNHHAENGNDEGIEMVESKKHDHDHEHSLPNKHGDASTGHDHSAIRSLILVASLSVHSLLEGIAMGLQKDVGSVVAIFVAVLFHKCLMAFSMGTNLVRGKQTTKRVFAAASIFALMSPCGIALGLIIKVVGGNSSGTNTVTAVLQAIATGTFLYITFFEVLVREFEAHGDRLLKLLSLFVGYGAVLGTFFAQHA